MDASNIFPIIVPASYYVQGTWDLPHYNLPCPSIILTWIIFGSGSTMTYISRDQFLNLNKDVIGWQQKSFENIRRSINDNENFFTHYKLSSDEQRLIFISFMNQDGIGSSRILLSYELGKVFSNGYFLAFPDRSCGFAIAQDITIEELNETKVLVRQMFQNARIPMSGELHSPSDFTLPQEWTKPMDLDFSNLLIGEMLNINP